MSPLGVAGCAANLFFDMWNHVAGIARRAAVAANLFFDRRMAASLAEALFFDMWNRIAGVGRRARCVKVFHCLRMY